MSETKEDKLPDLQELVADKIKKNYVEIMPPEEWDRVVDSVVVKFTSSEQVKNGHNWVTKDSPLVTMVRESVSKHAAERIATESKSWAENIDVEKVVKDYLEANAEILFQGMIGRVIDQLMKTATASLAMSISNLVTNMLPEGVFNVRCPNCHTTHDLRMNPQPYCCGHHLGT